MLTLKQTYIPLKISILLLAGILIFSFGSLPVTAKAGNPDDLSGMQEQAREYRRQGFYYQGIGDLDTAMKFYQKAVGTDPLYALAYNDVAIIYEAKGLIDEAEKNYLKCIDLDRNFLSVYSNLALLYEGKRDLQKAALYWGKRANMGIADDPWTQRAKRRLYDINLVLKGPAGSREDEVIGMMQEISAQKSLLKENNIEQAREYFRQAKINYNKHNYAAAFKQALDAQQLDPANPEIEEFIAKVQLRALSR